MTPVHYQPDGSSEWHPIELRFGIDPADASRARSDKAPVSLTLDRPSAAGGFLSLEAKGRRVAFGLPVVPGAPRSSTPALIRENGLFAEYPDFLPGGIAMRVFPRADGVKSWLVFNEKPSQTSFSFMIDAPGLNLIAHPELENALLLVDQAGQTVGRIPQPLMVDSSDVEGFGGGEISVDVVLSFSQRGDRKTITLTPDQAFLDRAVYPVYLDPTLVDYPSGSVAAYDTHVTDGYPKKNFDTYCRPDTPYYCEWTIGRWPGYSHHSESLINFVGVHGALPNAHIDSAEFRFWPYWQYYHYQWRPSWVERIDQSWTSSTVTWNTKPTTDTTTDPLDPGYFESKEGVWAAFDMKDHFQKVVLATRPEYGFKIHATGTGRGNWKRVISREEANDHPTKRPYLRIEWHRPAASPSLPTGNAWIPNRTLNWSYSNGDAAHGTPQSHFQVQVATTSGFGTVLRDSGWVASGATNWTFPTSGTTMTEGTSYWWRVRVKDGVGWSNWSAGAQFRYDTVAPTAAISAPSQNATLTGTVTISGTASDATSFDRYELHRGAGASPSSWTLITSSTSLVTNGTLANWNTGGLADGVYTIRLRVFDKARLTSGFSEVLRQVVVGDAAVAEISAPADEAAVGGTLTVVGTASAAAFTGYTLDYAAGCTGASWTQISSGSSPVTDGTLGTWNTGGLTDGLYRLRLVTSATGSSATEYACVTVDNTAPTALIAFPETGRPLAGTVAVSGTASDANLESFTLDYGAGTSPIAWEEIAVGISPITGGELDLWDTAGLQGVHTLRLTVTDLAGNESSATSLVYLENSGRGNDGFRTRVPFDLGGGWQMSVGVANGELTLDRHLFEIPSFGPAQSLALSYSSLNDSSAGLFGTGWSSNLTQHLKFEDGFVVWHRADGGIVPFGPVGGTLTPLAGHHESIAYAGGQYTITAKDQSKLVFEDSGAGRLTRIENRFGKALTLNWGASSATATDASNRTTNITVSGGRITQITDSAGRKWNFVYTGDQLTTINDPLDKDTDVAYSSDGLTSVTRSRSRVQGSETITWSVGYQDGLISSVTDPISSGPANEFSYALGETTVDLLKTYAGVHSSWLYALDDLGRVTETLDPEGYLTQYTFDADSNLLEMVLPIDHEGTSQTISYQYDDRGNVLTQTTQLTETEFVATRMSYNTANDLLILSEADSDSALKLVTRYTYDGSGHLTGVNVNCTTSGTAPPSDATTCTGGGTQNSGTNVITTYTWTANGQLATETDQLGRVTRHEYDSHGNEIETIANYVAGQGANHERNVSTTFNYDAAGQMTSQTDPVGNTTNYTYDALGRQTSESLPGDDSIPAVARTATYDELDNVLTETDAWSGVSRTTTYVYDKANRLVLITDPADVESAIAYDANGNEISSSHGGVTTTRAYDGLGRVTAETVAAAVTSHSYDGQGRDLETTDPEGVTTSRQYDLGGRLIAEATATDGDELIMTYEYDLLGRQTSSMSPDGIVTETVYDRAGRVTKTVEADAETTYTHDRAGNELERHDSDGSVTTTTYDPLDRAVQVEIDNPSASGPSSTSFTFYDAASRTVATVDPSGTVSRSIFNVRGLVETAIANCTDSGTTPSPNPRTCVGAGTHDGSTNVVSRHEYDGSGATVLVIVAEGIAGVEAEYRYAYDGAGRRIATRDPYDTVSRTFYDSNGRVTKTVANCTDDTSGPQPPSGNWWNCAGSGVQDGTWNVTSMRSYDARGNVASETASNGRKTAYEYDDADRLVERIDNDVAGSPGPNEDLSTYFAYDSAGRQVAVRSPTVDRTTFAVIRYEYNEAGQLARQIGNCVDADPGPWAECTGSGTKNAQTNLITDYEYDERGNRVAVISADPSAATGTSTATVTTRYAFDSSNRLCGVLQNATINLAPDPCATDPGGAGSASANVWTAYAYDSLGNLATMTDGRGSTTTYGYDASGRMVSITDGLGNTTAYEYDALGRRVSQSERGTGSQPTLVSWTYDAAGRMLSRTAGGVTTHYEYDLLGNRVSASGPGSLISIAYDRLGRPISVTVDGDTGATTSYTYSLTAPAWTDPSGSYAATLDAFHRQLTLVDPVNGSSGWSFSYRADGQPASIGAPNGNSTTFGYSAAGALTAKQTTAGSTNRVGYSWTHNRAGQILSEAYTLATDPAIDTTYAYDALGRLTGWDATDATATTYSWQQVPNRDSVKVGSDPAVSTSFDAANRIDDTGYDHDDEGRLVERPGQVLAWDDLGRLVEVSDGSTTIAAYTYDALDRLLTVTRGNDVIRFRYVGLTSQVAQVVDHQADADPSDDPVIRSLANDWTGARLFDWTATETRYYGTNAHHDVTWTAGETGAVGAILRYDPWGNLVSSTGTDLPEHRFQGSWFDTTADLYWVVARWYAPSLGRFISEDSLLGTPEDPPSRHLYAYGAGEPVGRWDPDGQYWLYVVKARLNDIAARTLGRATRWAMLWNANRFRFLGTTPTFRTEVSNTCLYIPTRWLVKSGLIGSDDNRCRHLKGTTGSYSEINGLARTRLTNGQQTAKLGDPGGLFSFTRSQLHAATQLDIGGSANRPKKPADWNAIEARVKGYNNMARTMIDSFNVGVTVHNLNPVTVAFGLKMKHAVVNDKVLKGVNEVRWMTPPWCAGHICVLGQYLFWGQELPDHERRVHEYIHVLQYEGLGTKFGAKYIDFVRREFTEGADMKEGKNPLEALPYVWQYWIRAFEKTYREEPPWKIWERPK